MTPNSASGAFNLRSSMDADLRKSTATTDTGAAFRADREGGFAVLTPLTPLAGVWLKANCDTEATWLGEALVVEMRYFPVLADAIIAAGFLFERDPLPN